MYSVKKNNMGKMYTRAESWLDVVNLPFELRPDPKFYSLTALVIPAVPLKWFTISAERSNVSATTTSTRVLSGPYEGEKILIDAWWSQGSYAAITIRSTAQSASAVPGFNRNFTAKSLRSWTDPTTNEDIIETLWGVGGVLEWWDYFLGRTVDIPDRLY